ncbi:MAG: hypothetical protein Q7U10_02230 [Thermodesulfovibrionia bacterium]|nr:hypothetical protein [Thermodesulfovibrionia bacterium]
MSKISGPVDIYKELVEDVPENEEWLLGLVAFGVIEEQKIEWMKHHRDHHGSLPTDEQIQSWYQQQPSGVLLRAKDTAQARLTSYAQDAITTYMSDFEKETVEGIVVQEIREIKKFWPQFGVNLVGGFASSLLFAALVTLIAFFVLNDASPVELGAQLKINNEEISND